MRQTKDGYAMTLSIHPEDMRPELFADPVGQRYMVALVAVGDDEKPMERPKERSDGERLVAMAGSLARDPVFQEWVHSFQLNDELPVDETTAADFIRITCGVQSRSELASSPDAQQEFRKLLREWDRVQRE